MNFWSKNFALVYYQLVIKMEHNGDGMILSINGDSVSGNLDASREIIGIQSAYAGDNDSVLNTVDCDTYEKTQSEIIAPEVHAADLNGNVSMMPITTVNFESKGADDVNLTNLKTDIPDRYNLNADIHEISTIHDTNLQRTSYTNCLPLKSYFA